MAASDKSKKAPVVEHREYKGDWWTCPTDNADSTMTIMVTGRRDVDKFRSNPRFSIRVDITYPYGPTPNGLPDAATAALLEQITDALAATFDRDPVAVMTGIYTGANERNWVFYTLSTHIFNRKLNEALSSLPLLPLSISAENDAGWEEYAEMRAATEIDCSD